MSPAVIPFDFETNAVRVAVVDGESVFVAADVCWVLEITNARDAVARLNDDERMSVLLDTLGGQQTMTAVTESGLFGLIMTSRKPAAKRFRKWVTAVVLPALRKHGTYSLTDGQQLDAKRAHYAALPGKVQDRAAERREAVEFVNGAIADGVRIGDATAMVADPDLEAALAPKWYHGPRRMLALCHPSAMSLYLDLIGRGLQFSTAYAHLQQEAEQHGWEPIPCSKTMMRQAQRVFPRLGAVLPTQIGSA